MLSRFANSLAPFALSMCFCACLSIAATGCGASVLGPNSADLEPWQGQLQNLFDDSVDPSAIGLAGPSFSTAQGAVQQRADKADYIVFARAVTVSTQGVDKALSYLISLRIEPEPVAGPKPPFDSLDLTITQDNPSFSLVKARDMQLTGTRFVAFLRFFPGSPDPVIHWHLARDGQDVVHAINNATLLSSVSKTNP